MKELWAVFYLGDRELFSYTVRGTYDGELKETKELLAYENDCDVRDIRLRIERRQQEEETERRGVWQIASA